MTTNVTGECKQPNSSWIKSQKGQFLKSNVLDWLNNFKINSTTTESGIVMWLHFYSKYKFMEISLKLIEFYYKQAVNYTVLIFLLW